MKIGNWIIAIVVIGAVGFGAFELGKRNSTTTGESATAAALAASYKSSSSSEPVATVHVAQIREDQITQELTFFGTVVVQQGEVGFVSVPLESRLKRVLVTPGQRVTKDQNLFELELSPAAKLSIEQAKINAATAQAELQQVQQKLGERLATNQDLSQAKQAAELASGIVRQLEEMNSQSLALHSAGFDGVVSKIDAQPGQIVPPGTPIIEVVSDNGIEIELGIEIEDIRMLPLDTQVKVSAVLADQPRDVKGKIRLMTETIDLQTRLAKIYVSLPAKAGFMLGETVQAVAVIETPKGLIVPRQAVIPDGSTDIVFIVENGKAIEKRVRAGIDNGSEMEIFSDELKPGDHVVTVGSSQLSDGMLIKVAQEAEVKQPPTTPPSSAPMNADQKNDNTNLPKTPASNSTRGQIP